MASSIIGVLSTAADQIGQALEQDRLGTRGARRSRSPGRATRSSRHCSTRSRTTCARRWPSIRAAAGTLLDADVHLTPEERVAAQAIDHEAEHLNGSVTNLLDLSRIEAGALRRRPGAIRGRGLVGGPWSGCCRRLAGRTVEVDVPDDLPPVRVDAVFFDQVLTNLLENAVKYAGRPAGIRVRADRHRSERRPPGDGQGRPSRTAGPGVPTARCRACSTSSTGSASAASLPPGQRHRAGRRPRPRRGDGRTRPALGAASSADWPSTSTLPQRRAARGRGDDRSQGRRGRARGPAGRHRILLVEDDGATRAEVAREPATPRLPGRWRPATPRARSRAGSPPAGPDPARPRPARPRRDRVVRRVRREAATPILIVSARGEEQTKVEALEQARTTT